MEKLYELAKVVRKQKDTLFTLIPKKDSSPLKKLATIVFERGIITDEECMYKVYGRRDNRSYANLKSSLYDKLTLLLLLQEESSLNSEDAIIQKWQNFKKIVASNILIARGKVDMGLEMLEKNSERAIRKNITENILISVRTLIGTFGSERYNKYKFNKYLELQRQYLEIYLWELKSQNYFLDLQKTYINSFANPTKEFIARALKYIQELEIAKNINSVSFIYNKYRIRAIYFESIRDFSGLLAISNQAIKDLSIPNYDLHVVISNINVRIIVSLFQTGKFIEVINFCKGISPNVKTGSNTWFRVHYYSIKAHIYTGNYSAALQQLLAINSNKDLKKYPYYVEIIETMQGYAHLLMESDYIKWVPKSKAKLPIFKLGKYLNSIPIYSKDKRGINVSILLMHIAFLLQRKDYDAIIDRTDSLNQYAYRYLRRDDSFRSNCMIKMVIQMTKADFNPVRTERYTADLLKQLNSVNLAGSGENIEIEVIPFEVLWKIMVKSL